MLSQRENELLTRVGPGTAMGDLLRRFWQPFALASELPRADCDPIRVRLLGEDLVGYRDSNGNLGLLAANSTGRWPHTRGGRMARRAGTSTISTPSSLDCEPAARSSVAKVERYEDSYRLCYVRCPEGIIVELAERIG